MAKAFNVGNIIRFTRDTLYGFREEVDLSDKTLNTLLKNKIMYLDSEKDGTEENPAIFIFKGVKAVVVNNVKEVGLNFGFGLPVLSFPNEYELMNARVVDTSRKQKPANNKVEQEINKDLEDLWNRREYKS
jgi:hypothetical protein